MPGPVSASQNSMTAIPAEVPPTPHLPDGANGQKPVVAQKTTKKIPPETPQEAAKKPGIKPGHPALSDTQNRALIPPKTSLLRWLQAKEPEEKPTMDLANNTLKKVRSYLDKNRIQIVNWLTPEELTCNTALEKEQSLCNTLLADCRQREENGRKPELSEAYFLEYCQIPSETLGVICDMTALLAYKELYQQQEVTPLLLGFSHPDIKHMVACIFHGKSAPEKGEFNFEGSIEDLGKNIHIIDPWFGFSCRASDYRRFVETASNHLNQRGYHFISDRSGQVTRSPFINFTANPSAIKLYHLPTLWKEQKEQKEQTEYNNLLTSVRRVIRKYSQQ